MAERAGATTTEAPGSHAIYVSQPFAVASLITGGTIPAPQDPWRELIPGCRQDIQRPAGRGHPRATVVAKAEPVGRGLSGDSRNS